MDEEEEEAEFADTDDIREWLVAQVVEELGSDEESARAQGKEVFREWLVSASLFLDKVRLDRESTSTLQLVCESELERLHSIARGVARDRDKFTTPLSGASQALGEASGAGAGLPQLQLPGVYQGQGAQPSGGVNPGSTAAGSAAKAKAAKAEEDRRQKMDDDKQGSRESFIIGADAEAHAEKVMAHLQSLSIARSDADLDHEGHVSASRKKANQEQLRAKFLSTLSGEARKEFLEQDKANKLQVQVITIPDDADEVIKQIETMTLQELAIAFRRAFQTSSLTSQARMRMRSMRHIPGGSDQQHARVAEHGVAFKAAVAQVSAEEPMSDKEQVKAFIKS